MTVSQAIAKRINQLLKQQNMSQYRLEQNSGIQHGSLQCLMNGRNKTVTLSTVIMIARGFGMDVIEFLQGSDILSDELEVE